MRAAPVLLLALGMAIPCWANDARSEPTNQDDQSLPVDLERQTWHVTQYRDGADLVAVGRQAYIRFVHGKLEGSPGCGGFFGWYERAGDELQVWARWILAGLCWPGFEAQNAAIMDALALRLTVQATDDGLVLRDFMGQVLLILARAPPLDVGDGFELGAWAEATSAWPVPASFSLGGDQHTDP